MTRITTFGEVGITVREGTSPYLLVTFGNYRHNPTLQSFFALNFSEKYGISTVGVSASRNHWWNTAGFSAAMNEIRRIAAGREIVTYGASMGGFGAVLSDSWLNPTRIISASPQLVIGPAAPWEKRWAKDVGATVFTHPSAAKMLSDKPQVYLLYDSMHSLDAKQARTIFNRANVTCLSVPWGGHPVLQTMREGGILSKTILLILNGALEPQYFPEFARTRRLSSTYLAELAMAYARRKHSDTEAALQLLERAIEWPGTPPLIQGSRIAMKARLLTQMRRYDEALEAMDEMEKIRAPTPSAIALKEKIKRLKSEKKQG